MVREFARKLRLAAAARGCGTRKELAAAFRAVNAATAFDLERADKWLHGKSLPRDAGVYRDWARLLELDRPFAWLAECAADELLEPLAAHHGLSREALVERAERFGRAAAPTDAARPAGHPLYLDGSYVCYSYAFSPYFTGRRLRGALSIGREGGNPRARVVYSEWLPIGRLRFEGTLTLAGRTLQLDTQQVDEGDVRLFFSLFVPPPPASVLAGLICGATATGASPEPSASRVVMIRLPAPCPELEARDAYLGPDASIAAELTAAGLPIREPELVDAMLTAFLESGSGDGALQVPGGDYAALVELFDRQRLCQAATHAPLKGERRRRLAIVRA